MLFYIINESSVTVASVRCHLYSALLEGESEPTSESDTETGQFKGFLSKIKVKTKAGSWH